MSRSSRYGTVAGGTLRDRQYPDQFRHCDYVTRPPARIAASRRVVVVSPHPPPNVLKSAGNHNAASPGCADQRLSLQRKTAANRQLQICRITWSPSSRRIARSASGVPSSSASISRECPATLVAITDLVAVFSGRLTQARALTHRCFGRAGAASQSLPACCSPCSPLRSFAFCCRRLVIREYFAIVAIGAARVGVVDERAARLGTSDINRLSDARAPRKQKWPGHPRPP